MKLDDLFKEIAVDFKIDEENLGHETIKTSDLFIKYIKYYTAAKLEVDLMDNNRKNLVSIKRDYYSGNAPPEVYKDKPFDQKVKNETTMKHFLDNDPDIVLFDRNIIIATQQIEVLAACMDEIKRRGYALKSAIDYNKFLMGH